MNPLRVSQHTQIAYMRSAYATAVTRQGETKYIYGGIDGDDVVRDMPLMDTLHYAATYFDRDRGRSDHYFANTYERVNVYDSSNGTILATFTPRGF